MTFAGVMAFGIPYALTVGITLGAGTSDLSDLQVWMLVPGVGPLIALGPLLDEPCDTGSSGFMCGLGKFFGTPLFVVDGLAQLVGIGVFIAGLTRTQDAAPPRPAPQEPAPRGTRIPWWVLAPGAPGAPLGLTITGQYF